MAKKLEIENKFLLKNVPNLKYSEILYITQYYLSDGSRIRETRDSKNGYYPYPFGKIKYELTVKKKIKNGVYEEDERKISAKKFVELRKNSISVIRKVRYVFKMGKLKWEIDKYMNLYMVTAEIELPKVGAKFNTPKEIQDVMIMDVTEFPQFTNKALAEKL